MRCVGNDVGTGCPGIYWLDFLLLAAAKDQEQSTRVLSISWAIFIHILTCYEIYTHTYLSLPSFQQTMPTDSNNSLDQLLLRQVLLNLNHRLLN